MDVKHVVKCLAALSHLNRFEVFRTLVQAGPTGMTPGMLNENLGIAPATMSFHLKELANADLVHSRTEGRRVIYSAKYETVEQAIQFVMGSCCAQESQVKAIHEAERQAERGTPAVSRSAAGKAAASRSTTGQAAARKTAASKAAPSRKTAAKKKAAPGTQARRPRAVA